MKILHISPAYIPVLGGAELHMKELSEGLASRGHDVTVLTTNVRRAHDLCRSTYGQLPACETVNGVRVVRVHPNGGVLGIGLNFLHHLRGGYRLLNILCGEDHCGYLLRNPMTIQMIPYVLRSNADIVAAMNWWFPQAYYVYLARRLRRFRLVGFPLLHSAEGWTDSKILKKMMAACDVVIANTDHEAEFSKRSGAKNISVGGVGICPSLFKEADGNKIRAKYTLKNLPVVGFVGRADIPKGAVTLLEAMKSVWKWNEMVRLVLAGPHLDPHGKVAQYLNDMSMVERKRVIQINDFPESEKASIFDAFDVFALPSVAESFGIAYLEAWMCRKPVIGARIGSTECVIKEGEDGLLVTPSNPEELAEAIILLLNDRELRQRMGEAGRVKALANFTWDHVTDRVENVYQGLLRDNLPTENEAMINEARQYCYGIKKTSSHR
jgi:glycosyltransferase involved in cell wall biosynthesis